MSPREKVSILDRAKNRLRKVPENSPDYLTPMRLNRAYIQNMKGKHNLGLYIEEVKARSRLKRVSKNKQMIFLGHLSNKGRIKEQTK